LSKFITVFNKKEKESNLMLLSFPVNTGLKKHIRIIID